MIESNETSSPIVPGFKVSKDGYGKTIDETYYKKLVGSLMYLTSARPGIMFVTCLISRYMAKPMQIHLQLAKRSLRYLKGTANYGLHYKKGGDGELLAFTDSDYARDVDDRNSTSGYVFLMSSESTTEVQFVAATTCVCQGIWMKRILEVLGHPHRDGITGTIELVHCGSKDQVADIMTKPLKLEVFQKLRKMLGVCEIPDIN
ncbi:secreted RxLR effector protein 161-like [Lathyrus oleraceus]|uniref:secreted RxLR effector protein 161-like n=1 Tax=Pisum sativum TaxID=3888 RepID=UPI0021CEA0E5|nr:secreted RxLR effector protein 161-like [Pisum sativum]